MRWKTAFTLLLASQAGAQTQAGAARARLSFTPERPRPGDTVTVHYQSATGRQASSRKLAFIHGFSALDAYTDRRRTVPLVASQAGHQLRIAIPQDASIIWGFVRDVSSGADHDDGGLPWAIPLHDSTGRRLPGARTAIAELWLRVARGEVAVLPRIQALADSALVDDSTSFQAYRIRWNIRDAMSNRSIAGRDSIAAEAEALVAAGPAESWRYRAASLGLNNIGRNDRAVAVMRQHAQRFPLDTASDGNVLFFFGNFGTLDDLFSLASRDGRWERSAQYWSWVFGRAAATRLPALVQWAGERRLALVPKEADRKGDVRYSIAERWIDANVDPVLVERVAREAVEISELGAVPPAASVTRDPADLARDLIVPINRSPLGWALYKQGRYDDAIRELRRAAAIRDSAGINSARVYYRLGASLEAAGDLQGAFTAYVRELAYGSRMEAPTRAALARIYERINGTLAGADTAIAQRVNALLLAEIGKNGSRTMEMNVAVGRFALLRPDGKPIDLSAYRGKIVILDYWATWCAPCLASLAQLHETKKRYGDDVVVVAVSSDPEETRASAAQFIERKGYRFELLFDDPARRSFNPPFIPARIVIDREGRMRLRELGFDQVSALEFDRRLRTLIEERQR